MQPDMFWVRVNGTRMRASADLYDMNIVVNRLEAGPKPIARLRDRLREAQATPAGPPIACSSRNSSAWRPGSYDGLWDPAGTDLRGLAPLQSGTEPPISALEQIAEVNKLPVAALTAEEFRF